MTRCLTCARRYAACIIMPMLLALGHPAQAATIVLGPGDVGTPPRVNLDIDEVLRAQLPPIAFDNGTIKGFVLDRVLKLSDGRYAFETTVFSSAAPTPQILEVTRTNFARFPKVEVGWEDADVTRSFIPDQVERSSGSGETITFRFSLDPITGHPPGVDPSEWSSNPVVVITDATEIAKVGLFQAFGTGVSSIQVNVFSPVPEPQTFAMLALGLCFAAAAIGRRPRAL